MKASKKYRSATYRSINLRKPTVQKRRRHWAIHHALIPFAALCGFVWLSYASEPYSDELPTEKDMAEMDALFLRVMNENKPKKMTEKEKAAVIMDIYKISEADLTRQVVLWGEK